MVHVLLDEVEKGWFDATPGSNNPAGVSRGSASVQLACWYLIQPVDLGFTACPGSFPSCHLENNPDPKSE